MNFVEAMKTAQSGFDTWAAKPHNAKWFKRIDGTPIPNDLLVNIAEALCAARMGPKGGLLATFTLSVFEDRSTLHVDAAPGAAPDELLAKAKAALDDGVVRSALIAALPESQP
jgi:hypothetical protein